MTILLKPCTVRKTRKLNDVVSSNFKLLEHLSAIKCSLLTYLNADIMKNKIYILNL